MRDIQVGVAYAIWSGLGTAAIVAADVVFRNAPVTLATVARVGLVIGGVVMLNLGGLEH